jgi:gas vesicle protein
VAFGLGKLQVIESKLEIYEDLSKEMLDKLERAVSTISENSNKIAIVLERHESRLDESERSDALILKILEEMKEEQKETKERIHDRISKIQHKVEENQKYALIAGAVLSTIVTIAQLLPMFGWTLTPIKESAKIDGVNKIVNEFHRHEIYQPSISTT